MFHTQQKAFTLLELILVVIILGIVASISSSVIVQVYESYIVQKATHNAALKTELAINQLANRLTYRIDKSLIARNPANNFFVAAKDVTLAESNSHTILEWIGYDNDGFSTQGSSTSATLPAWSGFIDLNPSTFAGGLISTGSDFALENTIIANLGGRAAIYLGPITYTAGSTVDINCLYANGNNACMFPVNLVGQTMGILGGDVTAGSMNLTEFYRLARSAYAVVSEKNPALPLGPNGGGLLIATDNTSEVWDLRLYYNYAPWNNEAYNSANTSSSILLRNVSVFRFKAEAGNSIRLKMCVLERISDTEKISLCKEKAVIR